MRFVMKHFIVTFLIFFFNHSVFAELPGSGIKVETIVEHLPVIDQGNTGTCWSFATTSFLESEIIRKGFPAVDLSEMYFVYHTYKNKGFKYLLFHGNVNYGEGGQAHDVIHVLKSHGMVPQEAFPGSEKNTSHNHRNL